MAVSLAISEIFSVKEWRDLENQVRGRSIDHVTFYWSAIVNIALSCTIFELFDAEYYLDLEIWVRGHSRSLKLVPFKSLGTVSYSPSIVTMAVPVAVFEIFNIKYHSKCSTGFIFHPHRPEIFYDIHPYHRRQCFATSVNQAYCWEFNYFLDITSISVNISGLPPMG